MTRLVHNIGSSPATAHIYTEVMGFYGALILFTMSLGMNDWLNSLLEAGFDVCKGTKRLMDVFQVTRCAAGINSKIIPGLGFSELSKNTIHPGKIPRFSRY